MLVGIFSDTHGYVDEPLLRFLEPCSQLWHAGDWGSYQTTAALLPATVPLKGVYGNIDGPDIRSRFPENALFEAEGVTVLITHIGGYPGRYAPRILPMLAAHQPRLFVSGHSHVLKIMRDPRRNNLMHINPGAAGMHGFHKMRTAVRLHIENGNMRGLEVWEADKSMQK